MLGVALLCLAVLCCQRKRRKRRLRDKDHALRMSLKKMETSPQAKRRTPFSSRDDIDGLRHEYDYISGPHTFVAPPGPLVMYDYCPPEADYDSPRRKRVQHHQERDTNNHVYSSPMHRRSQYPGEANYSMNNSMNGYQPHGSSLDTSLNYVGTPISADVVRYGPSPGSLRRLPRGHSPSQDSAVTANTGDGGATSAAVVHKAGEKSHQSPALPPRNYTPDISPSVSVTV